MINDMDYMDIGLIISPILCAIWLIPLYYLIALKAYDFILDDPKHREEDVTKVLYVVDDSLMIHSLNALFIFIFGTLFWPLFIIAIFIASISWVLRLITRTIRKSS